MKNILLIFVSLWLTASIFAQQTIHLDEEYTSKIPVLMRSNDRKAVKTKVDSILNLYVKWGSLIDPKKKKVTDEAATNFYRLFTSDAQLVKEYEENIPLDYTDPRGFANSIFIYFPASGFQFRIEKAYLTGIIDDKDYYIVSVTVEKAIYSIVDAKRRVRLSTGKFVEEEFKIDVPKSNFSKLKITQVRWLCTRKSCLPPDSELDYKSISAGYNMGVLKMQSSDYFKENHSESSFNSRQTMGWNIGADWTLNHFVPSNTKNKFLFLSIGLRAGQSQFKSAIGNYRLASFQTQTQDSLVTDLALKTYNRSVTNINLKETTMFSHVSAPIGLTYFFKREKRNKLSLSLKGVPMFVFYGKNSINGTGTYNAFVNKNVGGSTKTSTGYSILRTLKNYPAEGYSYIGDINQVKLFDVGGKLEVAGSQSFIDINRDISYSDRKEYYNGTKKYDASNFGFQKFVMSIEFSPIFYHDFSENEESWGVFGGLDINYQLISFFNHNTVSDVASEPLKFQYNYSGTLPNHYAKASNFLNVGFRIGIYKKILSQI
jgi:hypothetical protein